MGEKEGGADGEWWRGWEVGCKGGWEWEGVWEGGREGADWQKLAAGGNYRYLPLSAAGSERRGPERAAGIF